jgi:hypothetical protein
VPDTAALTQTILLESGVFPWGVEKLPAMPGGDISQTMSFVVSVATTEDLHAVCSSTFTICN